MLQFRPSGRPMEQNDLTPEGIEAAISKLYQQLSSHVADVVLAVSRERYSIPKERRRMGAAEFPYYFAADLDLLFRYALWGAEASAGHVEGLCDKVLDPLHSAPAGRVPEDWDALGKTQLGVAIQLCRARIKLRADDESLSAQEVALLSGLTPQKIAAARMKKAKSKGVTTYAAPDVRSLFIKEGVRV